MKIQISKSRWCGAGAWTLRALLAGALAGCATQSPRSGESVLPPHPVSWQELPAGKVGIVTTSSVPLFRVVYPRNAEDAAEEAATRLFWFDEPPSDEAMALTLSSGGVWLLPNLAVALAAQLGTRLRGISEPRLTAATQSLGRGQEAVDFQGRLARELGAHLGPALGRPWMVVPKPVPPVDADEVRRMTLLQAGTLAWLPDDLTEDAYLDRHEIETILEIGVRDAGLLGRHGVNPNLSLAAEVEVLLIRRRDGVVLARARAAYASRAHKFLRWADRGGRLLQEEFDRGCAELGRELAKGLLASLTKARPGWGAGHLVEIP